MAKEETLKEKMQSAFDNVDKISFLKNKREQEVFKLALQTSLAYHKEFVRVLKEKFDKNDWENNTLDVPENRNPIIDKLSGFETRGKKNG